MARNCHRRYPGRVIRNLSPGCASYSGFFKNEGRVGSPAARIRPTLPVRLQERSSEGVLRLPIDRVFTIKGFGTVVTGTLIAGSVNTEDVVEILPSARLTTRVRNIQVHETTVLTGVCRSTTALNLHGTEKKHQFSAGDVLSAPGLLKPTYMLDAYFSLLAERGQTAEKIEVGCAFIMAPSEISGAARVA